MFDKTKMNPYKRITDITFLFIILCMIFYQRTFTFDIIIKNPLYILKICRYDAHNLFVNNY